MTIYKMHHTIYKSQKDERVECLYYLDYPIVLKKEPPHKKSQLRACKYGIWHFYRPVARQARS